jgi:hypothetical protein
MNPYKSIEVFPTPARKLREKLSTGQPSAPSIPPGMVARMENSLVALKADYKDWVADYIDRLQKFLVAIRKNAGAEDKIIREIAEIALNLKNLGSTFGFTLISTISISLVNYCANKKSFDAFDASVIQTHLESLLLVFRESITGDGGPIGTELMANLAARVNKAMIPR